MTEEKKVPVPEAIKQLIISSNTLLQNYQQELTTRVQIANREMMQILGLRAEEGWQLDTTEFVYVKKEVNKEQE